MHLTLESSNREFSQPTFIKDRDLKRIQDSIKIKGQKILFCCGSIYVYMIVIICDCSLKHHTRSNFSSVQLSTTFIKDCHQLDSASGTDQS